MSELCRRAEAWLADHGEHDPTDRIGDVGGLCALAAFAESVTDDLRASLAEERALRAAAESEAASPGTVISDGRGCSVHGCTADVAVPDPSWPLCGRHEADRLRACLAWLASLEAAK